MSADPRAIALVAIDDQGEVYEISGVEDGRFRVWHADWILDKLVEGAVIRCCSPEHAKSALFEPWKEPAP